MHHYKAKIPKNISHPCSWPLANCCLGPHIEPPPQKNEIPAVSCDFWACDWLLVQLVTVFAVRFVHWWSLLIDDDDAACPLRHSTVDFDIDYVFDVCSGWCLQPACCSFHHQRQRKPPNVAVAIIDRGVVTTACHSILFFIAWNYPAAVDGGHPLSHVVPDAVPATWHHTTGHWP